MFNQNTKYELEMNEQITIHFRTIRHECHIRAFLNKSQHQNKFCFCKVMLDEQVVRLTLAPHLEYGISRSVTGLRRSTSPKATPGMYSAQTTCTHLAKRKCSCSIPTQKTKR